MCPVGLGKMLRPNEATCTYVEELLREMVGAGRIVTMNGCSTSRCRDKWLSQLTSQVVAKNGCCNSQVKLSLLMFVATHKSNCRYKWLSQLTSQVVAKLSQLTSKDVAINGCCYSQVNLSL